MNYKETMDFIEETNQYGSVLGLENIKILLEYLGNPQDELKFIHIAGTNGKGSVLAFLSTILKCEGYRVGRYCSPTIFEYRERIQINERAISKVSLADYMTRVREAVTRMVDAGLQHPTIFEIETALAFLYFKEKACDIVVLETGFGGTTDATNVVRTTVAAVITSIGMDHMAVLGNTLSEIAGNKAGIIKNDCYVITTDQVPEAMAVLQEKCQKMSVPLVIASEQKAKGVKYGIKKQSFTYGEYRNLEITLAGTYQIANAVLVIETIKTIARRGFPVSEKALYKGLSETVWSGRFSVIAQKPYFIADGAHNADAARRLAESIRFYFTNKKIIYIMGILKDKEYDKIIRETYPYAEHIIAVTTPHNQRAMQAYELAAEIKNYHNSVTAADSLPEAVEMSYLLADKETIIIAFGSLSYLGELITIVKNRTIIRSDTHGRPE